MDEFYFTAGRLIEALKELPPDLPVLISGYKSGFDNFYHPEVISLKHEPDNWFEDGEFQPADDEDTESLEAVILIRVDRDD